MSRKPNHRSWSVIFRICWKRASMYSQWPKISRNAVSRVRILSKASRAFNDHTSRICSLITIRFGIGKPSQAPSESPFCRSYTLGRVKDLAHRITVRQGDFVSIATDIANADIVTLDRVVCCYHDMPTLVGLSAGHACQLLGLVYPRDEVWVRAWVMLRNSYTRTRRSPFCAQLIAYAVCLNENKTLSIS